MDEEDYELPPSKTRNSQVRGIYGYVSGIDYNQMRMTYVGWYSATKKMEAEKLIELISNEYSRRIRSQLNTITDGTAGIGGNTIAFGKRFMVNAVEPHPLRHEILEEAVDKFKQSSYVKTYNHKLEDIYDTLNQDVLFIDPPWGGPNYKSDVIKDIKLGDILIEDWVERGLKRAKMIVFKLPLNYNIDLFVSNLLENIVIIQHFIRRADSDRYQIVMTMQR